jgi:hypothetical protein
VPGPGVVPDSSLPMVELLVPRLVAMMLSFPGASDGNRSGRPKALHEAYPFARALNRVRD